ncbi:MAG: hypothetical protein KGZ97_00940 [Bacteroidetes bacterium]|nr:hypothetical protein [Bacteroidota bacterium]
MKTLISVKFISVYFFLLLISSCNSNQKNVSIVVDELNKLKLELDVIAAISKSYNIFQEDWQADVYYDDKAFFVEAKGEAWKKGYYIKDDSVFLIEALLTEINEKITYYVEKDKLIHIIKTNTFSGEIIDVEVNDASISAFNEAKYFYNDYIVPLLDNENFASRAESLPGQDIEEGNEHFNYDAYLAYYAAENPEELKHWPKYIGTGDLSYTINYAGKFSSLFIEDENVQARLKKLFSRDDYFDSSYFWLLQDHNIEIIDETILRVKNPIKIEDKKIGWYNSTAIFLVDTKSSKLHFAFYDQEGRATHFFSEGIGNNSFVKSLLSEWVQ